MLSLILALLMADGNGVSILPFTSLAGCISGQFVVDDNGDYTLSGQAWGVPLIGFGHGSWQNGRFQAEVAPIYCDAEVLIRLGTPIPIRLRADILPEDCEDGDPIDDQAGDMSVRSQGAAGRGCIELRA